MSQEIRRSCIDCAVTRCDNHTSTRPHPAFCVSQQVTEEQRAASLNQYLTDQEDRKLAQVAAGIESDGYRKWPRVQETILFAKRMGYHKIGLAFCKGLRKEARVVADLLRSRGFEVVSVICKTGGFPKEAAGIPKENKIHPDQFEPMCNPIAQAELLNRAETQFNICLGLCVGHDSLFYRYSQAPVTTLVAKDRVLGHNPVAALYNAESYYKAKVFGPEQP